MVLSRTRQLRLHGPNRCWNIAVTRNEDDRHVRSIDCDLFLQVEAIEAGKSKIEHQTTRGPRTGGAGGGNRTPHLPTTIWPLYHLSYTGPRRRTLCDGLASYNQNLSHASGFPEHLPRRQRRPAHRSPVARVVTRFGSHAENQVRLLVNTTKRTKLCC